MSIDDELKDANYLGDAVYATFDGYHIWLLTSDGISITNRIALEPSVLRNLTDYAATKFGPRND